MAITDKTAIQNYTLTTIASSFDTQIAEWIAAVEVEMNGMTNRQLIADAVAANYKYDGNNKSTLLVDDFVEIVSVTINSADLTSSTIVTADCYFYPANSTPKWKIETVNTFVKGRQNVVINGKRGMVTQATLPADLKWAATVLVTGIINYSNNHGSEVASESIGSYSVSYNTDTQKADYDRALSIIKGYRRIR